MPTTANPLAGLYRRLSSFGLTRPFVRENILPSWWDDDLALNPAGYAEALLLLSRHLGLSLASLEDESSPIATRELGTCKFKKTQGTTNDQLALARAMATRIAQLAAEATTKPLCPLPTSAGQARQEILGQGQKHVSLSNLADYCWQLGIPVIHLAAFPARIKRPDGLAAHVNGRPAIVLCKKRRHPAWSLFVLAHELGHIVLGHVADGTVIIDETPGENEPDEEESAANAFALELLTGNANCRVRSVGRWPSRRAIGSRGRGVGCGEENRPRPYHP